MAKRRTYHHDELGRFKPAPKVYRGDGGRFRPPKASERKAERRAEAERRKRIDGLPERGAKATRREPTPPGQDIPRWLGLPIEQRGYGWGYRLEVVADVGYRYPMGLGRDERLELQNWRTKICPSKEDADYEVIQLLQRGADMSDQRGGFSVIKTHIVRYYQDPRGGAYDIRERRAKTPLKRLWIHGKVSF